MLAHSRSSPEKDTPVAPQRRTATALAFALVISVGIGASPTGAAPRPPDLNQRLAALEAAQQATAAEIARATESLRQMEQRLREMHDLVGEAEAGREADREELRAMREEVLGLYVDESKTMEAIGQVGDQVESLGASLERFRLAAGILVAVLVVMQTIGIALGSRARG